MATDKIIKQVIAKFEQRSEKGIEKYGTTLENNNTDDFLKHLQEELMDGVNYIEKLMDDDKKDIININNKDSLKKEMAYLNKGISKIHYYIEKYTLLPSELNLIKIQLGIMDLYKECLQQRLDWYYK